MASPTGLQESGIINRHTRPEIQIELARQIQGPGDAQTYTTGDSIRGTAFITAKYDTKFDNVDIVFEGTSSTFVDISSFSFQRDPCQTFLKLHQPVHEASYPVPRVLKAGCTYKFTFTFVVPARLLPLACSHEKDNYHIKCSHTLLPPTLGDHLRARNGRYVPDDMCPEMCKISYLIIVNVFKRVVADEAKIGTLASACKKIRIMPIVDEEPPLVIYEEDRSYCLHKEEDVRRGLLREKLGRLVISASQPRPIQLLPKSCEATEPAGTVVTLNLRFQPVGHKQPPQLRSVWGDIRVFTFYGAGPWADYPSPSFSMCWALLGQVMDTKTVNLRALHVTPALWVKHSTASINQGNTYYMASVVVPVALPLDKTFIPTFHSCRISRIYSLDLGVSFHSPNANILTPTISLKIPIQFASQYSGDTRDMSRHDRIATLTAEDNININPPAYSDGI